MDVIYTSTDAWNALDRDILSQGGPHKAFTTYVRGNKIDFGELRHTKTPGVIDYAREPIQIVKPRRR